METVVAVFDNATDAQEAVDRLVSLGISRKNVSLNTDDYSRDTVTTREEGGGGFFAWLFGEDTYDDTSYYSEAANRGHTVVAVDIDNEAQFEPVARMLRDCGAIDIEERANQWRSEGWTGPKAGTAADVRGTSTTTRTTGTSATDKGAVLPVVQDELKVGKRAVRSAGGVRVYQRVRETPVEQTVTLREERARIERTAVDRPATEADFAKRDGVIEVSEKVEEPVVSKESRVVEEVRVGKDVTEHKEKVRDTVRSTEVHVERTDEHATARDKRGKRDDATLRGDRPAASGTDVPGSTTGTIDPSKRRP
jgi:uncharacterized protein (TIGR02271 family)